VLCSQLTLRFTAYAPLVGTGPLWRAPALATITTPTVLLAHLATTGALPAWPVTLAVVAVGLIVGALAPAVRTAGLAVVVGISQLSGDALLMLTEQRPGGGCLPAVGRGAALGLRMAALREDPACPPGTMATGPFTQAALLGVLTAAVLVVTHLLFATLGGMLVTAVERSVGALRAIAALVTPRPVRLPPPATGSGNTPPAPVRVPLPRRTVPLALTHRGPPVRLGAR